MARWGFAMFQMACSKAAPSSSGRRPPNTSSRRPGVQDMLSARRSYSASSSSTLGGASVRATSAISPGAFPTATRANSASVSGVANSGGGCDLVERQRARAERAVECGQAAQRAARARDAHGGAVSRCCRPVPATGRSTSTPPPANHRCSSASRTSSVFRCCEARLLLADRPHLAPPRRAATLQRLIDRPLQCGEHTFAS